VIASSIGIVMAVAVLYLWYERRARRLSAERLAEMIGHATAVEVSKESPARTIRAFPRRHRVAAYSAGVATTALLWAFGWVPVTIAIAAGTLVGVLAHLIERQGRAISRAQLVENALSPFDQPDARTVDSHIRVLRAKLGPRHRGLIRTARGVGYGMLRQSIG